MTQININLKENIIPEKGLGGITLGMNIFFLKECLKECFRDWDRAIGWKETKKVKFEFYDPFISNYIITYKQTIDIYVNTFLGKVQIGDKAKRIKEYADKNKLQFDMGNVGLTDGQLHYVSEGVLIKFEIGKSNEDFIVSEEHWNELMNRKIKSITLWRNDLSIAIDTMDFPEHWKGTAPEKIGL